MVKMMMILNDLLHEQYVLRFLVAFASPTAPTGKSNPRLIVGNANNWTTRNKNSLSLMMMTFRLEKFTLTRFPVCSAGCHGTFIVFAIIGCCCCCCCDSLIKTISVIFLLSFFNLQSHISWIQWVGGVVIIIIMIMTF